MNSMLGELLPLAIGIALSPLPVVAQILMLFGKRARSNGPAFMLGWVLALSIWGSIMLLAADAGKLGGGGTPSIISGPVPVASWPHDRLADVYRPSLALSTDLYQLTMAQAYRHAGRAEEEAASHLFFRRNPFGGGFAVACGLARALDYLAGFHFAAEDVAYLGGLLGNDGRPLFEPSFLADLEAYGLVASRSLGALRIYDSDAVEAVIAAAGLCARGLEPRHLRLWRTTVDKELGLIEQLVTPLLRQRNPKAREHAGDGGAWAASWADGAYLW